MTQFLISLSNRLLRGAISVLIFTQIATSPIYAEDDWFSVGKDVLKNLEQKKSSSGLAESEIGAGLKEALQVGADKVVSSLGHLDGFNKDPWIHIPLPEKLQSAKTLLKQFGLSGLLDDLELKLNRSAEQATGKAKALFTEAIKAMTFKDVMEIFNGPDDAATTYFKSRMSPQLKEDMRPIVKQKLAETGAVKAYDSLLGQKKAIPLMPDLKSDLTEYVIEKGIDGIFYYLAKEEAAIRKDPMKRTTELLKKVFGSKK